MLYFQPPATFVVFEGKHLDVLKVMSSETVFIEENVDHSLANIY